MNVISTLNRHARVVLGAAGLYFIFSFLHWQEYSATFAGRTVSGGIDEWHGIGILAGLLVVALLAWEAVRLFQVNVPLGPITPAVMSLGLALALTLFTIITFLSHSQFRAWPEWLGLVLSIVIAVAAVLRAQGEGVQMPAMAKPN